MLSTEKRALFVTRFTNSITNLNQHLNGIYKKEFDFEIRRQYRNLSLTHLRLGNKTQYNTLYRDYIKKHTATCGIKALFHIGEWTGSEKLTNLVDRIFFHHPNPFIRVFRKTIKSIHARRLAAN